MSKYLAFCDRIVANFSGPCSVELKYFASPTPSSGLLGALTLAEADTWTSAVLVDEFDARQRESPKD
jgi:hypothetical protein